MNLSNKKEKRRDQQLAQAEKLREGEKEGKTS